MKTPGMYYTPREIADPSAGSGGFLKDAADYVLSNPPYAANTPTRLRRFTLWLMQFFRQ